MPEPQSYVSIGIGNKLKNMARVHAGTYTSLDRTHTCPVIVVVKCGNPEEANDPKPGNRGKRDSQVILMNFLNRVIFNDRMTPLDYELTYQIQKTANVFPDRYDLVLMVDADTKVKPESLNYMVKAMVCDEKIMGLCGETRVYNKTDSFITQIQVFEYYISHHLSKAFESVFGGVTCLPGCFCMYRIKSRKPNTNYIIPILANPDIIAEYSQNIVKSLHQKNLLLLGEDRFLSTLMLKTFPKRKMMFVPQARCKTIVPDTFKVLLSQRRRWINSTVHNLVKLVFVNDLCGTFCFSMQFVIFFELCGTVVLPAALCFTIYILISFIFSNTLEILPMILLLVILGLPGVLIFVTFNNWHYFLWMIIYLIALPIWNFILPLYAVWHMDDFSWGETRKISSSGYKNNSNGNGNGNDKDNDNEFSSDVTELNHTRDENKNKRVPFKHWSEYEYERLLETKPKGSSSSSLLPEQGFKGTTLSMGHALTGSSLTSTLIPLNMNSNSTMYSTLISNYNHNGGSNSKINYHDLYQRSQYTTNTELYHHFNKKNSEIDKFESIIGKSDISEIRKSDMISNTKKLHFHDKNILSSLGNDDNTTRNYNAMKNTGREHYFEMNDSSILNNIFNTNPYKNHKIDHSNINVINEYKTNNNNAKVVDHHDNYQPQIMNNFSRETRSNHGHYNDDLDMTNIRNLRNESFKYSNNNSSVRDNERDKPHYYYNQKGFQEDLYHNKEKSKDNKYPSAKVENISSRRCSRNGQYIPLNTEFNTDPKPELPKRVSSIKHGNK
jgi:chitin synthase